MIVTKARGKSGPLFHFDVHDDIRLLHDATVEKDEVCFYLPYHLLVYIYNNTILRYNLLISILQSHAAKVVERRWYERNKHIFPASRWEVYDPSVQREKYTIHDRLKIN